ncbi:MAG: hypothetical protein LBT62_04920 [Deltaproteobacteria bacterium]|jgi:hypothetical protein|nr:hypothetical protein [Deltaproteobacteria bacterium]
MKKHKISDELTEAYKKATVPLRELSYQIYIEEGRLIGREEAMLKVSRSMLADGLSVEIIRKCTGLEENAILSLKKSAPKNVTKRRK